MQRTRRRKRKSQPERFEILILGSGGGGKLLAWHMARSGRRTAVVERRWIGGSCPNIAYLPSKNEIWSAKAAYLMHHAAEFGMVTGSVAVDMATVRQRKRDMVAAQVAAHLENYKTTGAELILGSARFVAPKTLEVSLSDGGTRVLSGDQVFLNVGTHAAIPNVPGLEAARPLTHIEGLELDYLPPHLIVLGGGYVGLELAQAYRRFGSRVTVIEHGPQLMRREDPDVADEVQRILSNEGIQILMTAEILHVHGRSGEEVSLVVRTTSGEQTIEGSDILVAAGRTPNTAGIGLEEAGIELDSRGYIRVNERLETSASKVWAIGECAGSPQFTHVSVDDFQIIRDNLAGGKHSTRDRLVPYCMFTDPPLAHVGLSEREAQRQDVTARVAKLSTSAVLRAQATGERQGFMKALVGGSDDRILGFTMIGAEAGEVMAAVQTAMLADLPYPRLRDAILAHPTMAEGLGSLFSNVPPRSVQAVVSNRSDCLGSGSTAAYAVRFLGERVRGVLKIRGVSTSVQTQNLAACLGIPLTTLEEVQQIDVTIDGADEFDPELRLIKGGGGALLREKVVASATRDEIIITDSSKQVLVLGKFPLPVEVIRFAEAIVSKKISALGATVQLRKDRAGEPFITDEGHHILDCHFGQIPDPPALAYTLSEIPGVVEHGLFINLADVVLLGKGSAVLELRRKPHSEPSEAPRSALPLLLLPSRRSVT